MRCLLFLLLSLALPIAACGGDGGSRSSSDDVARGAPDSHGACAGRRERDVLARGGPHSNRAAHAVNEMLAPGPPRVDFIGRFDARDPAGPKCAWPGCRIVARFKGTSVSARLSEITEPWMKGGPSEWDVSIDGQLISKLVTRSNAGPTYYDLASSLSEGVHVVELYKRSEAQNGTTQFLGYEFSKGELLAPPARKVRTIETIGDSQAAGFGVEGVGRAPMCPGRNYAARWQNFRKSFGARLGEDLNAEVFGTVYSGKGVVKNIWHPDKSTMPMLFPRTLPTDPNSTWNFDANVPDVVILMLGGNDFAIGQPVDEGPPTLAQFTDAYDAFVVSIREKYPEAHILLVTSPSVSDAQPQARFSRTNVMTGIAEVVARRRENGDEKVYASTPREALESELTGCEGHGNPEFHQRVANDLAPIVRERTGW